MEHAEEYAVPPSQVVEGAEERARLGGLVEIAVRKLAQDVQVTDGGAEVGDLGVEALHHAVDVEGEAAPDREVEPLIKVVAHLAVVGVEAVTAEERPEPELRAPRSVLLLDEEHAAPGGHRKASRDRQGEREAECFVERVVGLPELLLAPDPAAALRGEEILDV